MPVPTPAPVPQPAPLPEPVVESLPNVTILTIGKRSTLSEDTLEAGSVTLTLRNVTLGPITVSITVRPGRVLTRKLAPKSTRKVTVILAEGQRRIRVGATTVGSLVVKSSA
jgi:hypothetical protein